MKDFFKLCGTIGDYCVVDRYGTVIDLETNEIRTPTVTRTGMRYYSFYDPKTGKQRNIFVHYLLAEAFLGYDRNEKPRKYVSVRGGNYSSFTIDDIEITDKRSRRSLGEYRGSSMRDARRVAIIGEYESGVSQQEIADKYGVSRSLISLIITGKR